MVKARTLKRGWFLEPYRHSLSARGITTTRRIKRARVRKRPDSLKIMFSQRSKYFADSDFVDVGGETYLKLEDGRLMNISDPNDVLDSSDAARSDFETEVNFLSQAGIVMPEALSATNLGFSPQPSFFAHKGRIVGLREVGSGRFEVRMDDGEVVMVNSRDELEELVRSGGLPVMIGKKRLEQSGLVSPVDPLASPELTRRQQAGVPRAGVKRGPIVSVEVVDGLGAAFEIEVLGGKPQVEGARVELERPGQRFPATVTVRHSDGSTSSVKVRSMEELKSVVSGGEGSAKLFSTASPGRPPQPVELESFDDEKTFGDRVNELRAALAGKASAVEVRRGEVPKAAVDFPELEKVRDALKLRDEQSPFRIAREGKLTKAQERFESESLQVQKESLARDRQAPLPVLVAKDRPTGKADIRATREEFMQVIGREPTSRELAKLLRKQESTEVFERFGADPRNIPVGGRVFDEKGKVLFSAEAKVRGARERLGELKKTTLGERVGAVARRIPRPVVVR